MSDYDKATAYEAIRAVLISAAQAGETITYEELCRRVGSEHISVSTFGLRTRLSYLLNDICEREPHMLTAVVVNKALRRPGAEFFHLARRLELLASRDEDDEKAFWEDELARVHAHRWC